MSKTKEALELGIELNAIQEYLEDDVLPEYFECEDDYRNAVKYVRWARRIHETNGCLNLGVTPGILIYLKAQAMEFTLELDDEEHDYIEIAEALLNYYRQAWNWEHEKVARFDVRKRSAEQAQIILNKARL